MNKEKLFLTILCIYASALSGIFQNYHINFTGSGEKTTVGSIEVLNLTQNTTTTLGGNDILVLSNIITGNDQLLFNDQRLRIYPGSSNETVKMEFINKNAGLTTIDVYDITGKRLASTYTNLQEGNHRYEISGLNAGIFLINVQTNAERITGRIISNIDNLGKKSISYLGTVGCYSNPSRLKSSQSMVKMQYTTGERLLFKGISGKFSRVLTKVPTENQTINFEFVSCLDADGNHYPVVTIGSQVWMGENLAFLPSVSPSTQDSQTGSHYYVSGYQGTNVTEAKATVNYQTYGVLYNWHAAMQSCPAGWHLPTDVEWETMKNYLIANGYNFDGTTTGNKIAKSMANSTDRTFWTETGTIGNIDYSDKQNATGFSALPGGHRDQYKGVFNDPGSRGCWWSATEESGSGAWGQFLAYLGIALNRGSNYKGQGYSVRCLKDN